MIRYHQLTKSEVPFVKKERKRNEPRCVHPRLWRVERYKTPGRSNPRKTAIGIYIQYASPQSTVILSFRTNDVYKSGVLISNKTTIDYYLGRASPIQYL